MVSRRNAVFEHEGGHAEGIQPARHLIAFVVDRQMPVAAARAYHHAGARSLIGGRQVKEPTLFDMVEVARQDQDRVYKLLLSQIEQQRIAATQPGTRSALWSWTSLF